MEEESAFTIVIPTYYESEAIGETIKSLESLYPRAEIIVVDDTPDNSVYDAAVRASRKVRVITHTLVRRGLSGSVLVGIKEASHNLVVVTDADMQHPIAKISDIVRKLKEGCKVVVAEREMLHPEPLRRIISEVGIKLANLSLKWRGKKELRDPLSGFFGLRKEVIGEIDEGRIVKEGWKIAFDIVKQLPSSYVCEVTFPFLRERKKGKSKLSLKPLFLFLLSLIK